MSTKNDANDNVKKIRDLLNEGMGENYITEEKIRLYIEHGYIIIIDNNKEVHIIFEEDEIPNVDIISIGIFSFIETEEELNKLTEYNFTDFDDDLRVADFPFTYFKTIYTKPQYQGRNFGMDIFTTGLDKALELDKYPVILSIWKKSNGENDAYVKKLKNMGFNEFEILDDTPPFTTCPICVDDCECQTVRMKLMNKT